MSPPAPSVGFPNGDSALDPQSIRIAPPIAKPIPKKRRDRVVISVAPARKDSGKRRRNRAYGLLNRAVVDKSDDPAWDGRCFSARPRSNGSVRSLIRERTRMQAALLDTEHRDV